MKAAQIGMLFSCACVFIFIVKIHEPDHVSTRPETNISNVEGRLSNMLKSIPWSSKKQSLISSSRYIVPKLMEKSQKYLKTPLTTKMKCSQKYRLLIMVTSQSNGFGRRSNIRSTWGSTWHQRTDLPSWKTIFQLGLPNDHKMQNSTLEEATKYKDMIFGNLTDTFYTLSVKVIVGFEWATKYCDFDFLLKTDDDVFVNIPNVFKFLSEPDIPRHRLYAGNVHFRSGPIRWRSKYRVTTLEYPYRQYPRFTSGGGMVLSRDVAAGMVNIHNNSNYFKLDDVYVGMLALRLGVDAHHDDWFQVWQKAENCKCEERTIVRHGAHNRDCMDKLYKCFPNLYENYVGFVDKENHFHN